MSSCTIVSYGPAATHGHARASLRHKCDSDCEPCRGSRAVSGVADYLTSGGLPRCILSVCNDDGLRGHGGVRGRETMVVAAQTVVVVETEKEAAQTANT